MRIDELFEEKCLESKKLKLGAQRNRKKLERVIRPDFIALVYFFILFTKMTVGRHSSAYTETIHFFYVRKDYFYYRYDFFFFVQI